MNMQEDKQSNEDERFARTAQELLRDSAEHLDAATLSQLNQARQKALAGLSPGRKYRRGRFSQWAPVGAVAATAVLAAILWPGQIAPPIGEVAEDRSFVAQEIPLNVATDIELLLAEESLEMIEDLEFFTWLDAGMSTEELQAELELTG